MPMLAVTSPTPVEKSTSPREKPRLKPPLSLMLLPPLRLMPMPTTVTTAITMLPMPTAMPTVPMVILDTSTPMLTSDTTVMPVSIITVRDLLMLRLLPPLMLMPMPTTDTTAIIMPPTPTAMPTVPMLPMLMADTAMAFLMAMESKMLPP